MENTEKNLRDEELLLGSNEQFEQLLKLYGKPIRAFFMRRTNYNEADSDDLYQNTFMGAFANRGQYKRGHSPYAWIFGIAGHQLRRHLLKIVNSKYEQLGDGKFDEPAYNDSILSFVEIAETEAQIEHELDAVLAGRRREVFRCLMSGMCHAEIAGRLSMSVNAVGKAVREGRAILIGKLPQLHNLFPEHQTKISA